MVRRMDGEKAQKTLTTRKNGFNIATLTSVFEKINLNMSLLTSVFTDINELMLKSEKSMLRNSC